MMHPPAKPAGRRRFPAAHLLASAAFGLAGGQAAAAPASAPVAHVFLVQNSGWMEPFYVDPASPFKSLVTELVLAATQADDALVLAAFNQSLPGAPSPLALLSARVEPATLRARLAAALAPLSMARKPGSAALADTDLNEAVGAAIEGALERKPGLIWLITNNRNSPGNDQATARRNREFYERIHQGAEIRMALAFPLRMPVAGAHYRANGLMVYLFAIGEQGVRDLDALLDSGRLAQLMTERPARLKPLDRDTVRVTPAKVEDAPGVRFSMADSGGGVLRADVQPGASSPAAKITWNLENRIYPYTIVSARVAAQSRLAGADRSIRLGKDSVAALAPGQSAVLTSLLELPAARLPGKWSLDAIRAAGSAYVLPGSIEVRLSEQKLELAPAFRQRMAALFPGDPLPDIFTPPARVQGSLAILPLEVRVHYGIAPLLALIGGALALLAAPAGVLLAAARPRTVQLMVEGERQTLITRAGAIQPVFDRAGNQVAELKSTLWSQKLTKLRAGAQVWLA